MEKYEKPKMDIVDIEKSDVILTSECPTDCGQQFSCPYELPFIPS